MHCRRLLLSGAALAAAPAAGVSAPHDPILRMIEDAEKLHRAWLATPEYTPEQIQELVDLAIKRRNLTFA